jgi:hypothetical protein
MQMNTFLLHGEANLGPFPCAYVSYVIYILYVLHVWHVFAVWGRDAMKQNVTISLDRQTIRKAKIVAARRDTSISGLLAQQIEILVGEDEAYERAERQAVALLDEGFHLGGGAPASREELHER